MFLLTIRKVALKFTRHVCRGKISPTWCGDEQIRPISPKFRLRNIFKSGRLFSTEDDVDLGGDNWSHGRPHIGSANPPPMENGWKIKKQKRAKKSSFLCLCYILRAIRAGRCRERRYNYHLYIVILIRLHDITFIVSKLSVLLPARCTDLTS